MLPGLGESDAERYKKFEKKEVELMSIRQIKWINRSCKKKDIRSIENTQNHQLKQEGVNCHIRDQFTKRDQQSTYRLTKGQCYQKQNLQIVFESPKDQSLDKITIKKQCIKYQRVGIQACHQRCILHRDFKPQNILINKQGYKKIADFGFGQTLLSINQTFYSQSCIIQIIYINYNFIVLQQIFGLLDAFFMNQLVKKKILKLINYLE